MWQKDMIKLYKQYKGLQIDKTDFMFPQYKWWCHCRWKLLIGWEVVVYKGLMARNARFV
jgi:hypothetical protein